MEVEEVVVVRLMEVGIYEAEVVVLMVVVEVAVEEKQMEKEWV